MTAVTSSDTGQNNPSVARVRDAEIRFYDLRLTPVPA
jgi:hypothetical protein